MLWNQNARALLAAGEGHILWLLWAVVKEVETKAPVEVGFWSGPQDRTFVIGGVSRPYVATADMIGRGIPYAIFRLKFDQKLWASGEPKVLFVVDGLPLYDPRDGQTRFTENAAVIAWNVARGITLPDGSVYGVGIPEEDLPAAEWAQAMNTCDSEGYKYGGEVSIATPDKGGETPLDVLEEIGLSANMRFAAVAGRLHVQVGAPALPSRFITDADVLVSQPESMTPFVPQAEVVNALHASHPLPDQRWQVKEAPPLYSADDEAADGERKPISLDFPGVADPEQVQKLMKSMLADHRRQRQHTLAIPPSESTILPLGTLAWTSDINGYQGKLFEAAEIAIDAASLCVTVALRERDPSDYDWNSQTDYTPVTPGPIEVPEPNPVQLEGLTAEGVTIIGEGGQARPALRISWTDDLIEPSPIRWEVRLATGEAVSSGSEHGLTAPEHVISQGILADMPDKPIEFWVALVSGMAWVARQSEAKGPVTRMVEAGMSGGIGYSLAPDLAEWSGRSETLVVFTVSAFAFLVLDVLTSLVRDREAVKSILVKRLGGGQ